MRYLCCSQITSETYGEDVASQPPVVRELEYKTQLEKEPHVYQLVKPQADTPGQCAHPLLSHIDRNNIHEISEYLQKLGKTHILHLGMALGISHSKLTKVMDSQHFLDHVITAWLHRGEQQRTPTWVNLISALMDPQVRQERIASEILRSKSTSAESATQNPKVSELIL